MSKQVDEPATGTRDLALRPTTWLIVAVLLVAANLRPAVTSLGSVLDEVRVSLGVSADWISVLTALPGLCFGLAGFLAPVLARRLGLARAIGLAVALLTIGLAARVLFGSTAVLVGTFVACAGIAVCNVLIPVVIKESYPLRIGLLTGLYTAVLQGAAALGSALTPPLDAATGGWRPALGTWAAWAAAGFLLWMVAARHGSAGGPRRAEPVKAGWGTMLHSPLAWLVTAFFGLQAMFAYVMMGWLPQVLIDTAGVSRGLAGAMMAVASVIGVPVSLVVTPLATRRRSQSTWTAALTLTGAVGVAGLLVAPTAATWLWVVCVGVGMGVFAVAVTLISLRTRTSADTRQLSTMAQSTGYLLAAVGPLLVGVLRGASGNWTVSLVVVLVALGVQVVIGTLAGRDRLV